MKASAFDKKHVFFLILGKIVETPISQTWVNHSWSKKRTDLWICKIVESRSKTLNCTVNAPSWLDRIKWDGYNRRRGCGGVRDGAVALVGLRVRLRGCGCAGGTTCTQWNAWMLRVKGATCEGTWHTTLWLYGQAKEMSEKLAVACDKAQ